MNETRTIRVLLVEDSPSDVAIFKAWLSDDNTLHTYSVTDTHSLENAIDLLARQTFDIVLLDLGLTDSSGLATLRSIATERKHVPVVVLTGLADEQLALDAVRSGAQDFLVKGEFNQRGFRRCIRYSVERHALERERSELSRLLLTVLEDEKQRIAKELHDEVGGGLSGLNYIAMSLVKRVRQLDNDAEKKARLIADGIQEVLDSFRLVLNGLSPVDVDQQGLAVALERLCESVDDHSDEVACRFRCDSDANIGDNIIATNLYRIAQESLTNALKYAHAKTLGVDIRSTPEEVVLRVTDDGVGFNMSQQAEADGGRGLRIMRHRSDLIGGTLAIESGPTGTIVECRVQIESTDTDGSNVK